MGSTAKKDRRSGEYLDEEDELDLEKKANKKEKQGELKGLLNSIAGIADEIKGSSRPPSPASFSLEGRKPAEIFRTDLISAMKLPDHQNLSPDNYMTISDPWRQEWERGVQRIYNMKNWKKIKVPVNPEGVFQPSFRPVEPLYKRAGNFKLQNRLLVTPSKTRGRPPGSKCPYDLGRMDVEWLTALNKSRQNKGLMELEESTLEKSLSYIENKCYDNMGHAIATQEGLSIEYDEDVCCDVCQSPDSEELNEMVFCDSCDICVHQACYGIQNIPAGSWLCHPCRKGIKNCHCVLCNLSGGAVKKTKNGKGWVHVSCALWIPEVGFGNVAKMEPVTRIENVPASRWNLVCSLCREKVGACIQCTVKSCVTAFHVTCGFKHGLEMRTVLDDAASDGVRHISYCTKHSHKSKSPSKKAKEESSGTSTSSEDAENLRQKRLKQMEDEFYKYVNVAEIAKDMNLPKELAARVHKYWTLKRKAQDDVPLLPPTLQQQEKLSGKQGAVSSTSNLQAQLERIVKLRCNLEKLRNLCYMVTKREKMRRELYRAREEVFWKEYEVMTDESCDLDEEAVQRVLAMCKDNFIGVGSLPGAALESLSDSLSSRVSSTVETSSTTSSSGDCSSTEQNSREGGGDDPEGKSSRGGAADGCGNQDSSDPAEALDAFPARRTRRNSHAVSQASSSGQPVNSTAGSSKESESTENSDSDATSRKRTRVKSESLCEASGITAKRVLRHTITEMGEAAQGHNSLERFPSGKPRRRTSRHLSFPNVMIKTKEDSDKEGVATSEDDGESSDAMLRETRSRTPRGARKRDASETGSEHQTLEKPEVDEKESRKENDPLRRENMAERQGTWNKATKTAAKRKRSKSATAVVDNTRIKQARITNFLRRKSPSRKELTSPKSLRLRGSKSKSTDSEESDEQVRTEPRVDSSEHVTSPRSFSNGRETTGCNSCPNCKLQHDKLAKCSWRCKDGSHTAECEDNWNRRELRLRSFQSPKSRARCSHAVSPKPHCCSSLMSKFCHATVT